MSWWCRVWFFFLFFWLCLSNHAMDAASEHQSDSLTPKQFMCNYFIIKNNFGSRIFGCALKMVIKSIHLKPSISKWDWKMLLCQNQTANCNNKISHITFFPHFLVPFVHSIRICIASSLCVCVCVRPCACVWMRFQMCVASHQLQRKLNERKKAVRYVYALWLTIFESLFCNWVNVVWWILVHQLVNVALSWCRFWIAKTTTTTKTVAPSICNNLSHLAARHRLNNHHIWKHRH